MSVTPDNVGTDTTQSFPRPTFPQQMVWTVIVSALSVLGWLVAAAVLALDHHEPGPLVIGTCIFAGACGIVSALLGIDYRRREAAAIDRILRTRRHAEGRELAERRHQELLTALAAIVGPETLATVHSLNARIAAGPPVNGVPRPVHTDA